MLLTGGRSANTPLLDHFHWLYENDQHTDVSFEFEIYFYF
jgi:hypothetical protein